MVDAMAKDGAARLRLRPVGAADRKKLPEYGPLGTGCPAVERAVAALYKGQNEESFWALMNAINYALELDTRVLVPLEASSDQPDGAAPWAEHPVPAEKAKDLPFWTLHTQKGRCYLPLFTSVRAAEADKGTASRPMAEMLLSAAMQSALDSDHIDGVVIDPWTSSATLDCSLLNGLLHAGHDTSEPGEEELRAGNRAMAEGRWDDAMHFYQLSAEEGCAEGLAMMGELLYEGKGCRKAPRRPGSSGKSRRCRRRSRMGGAGRRRHGTGQGRGRRPAGLPQGPEALRLHPRRRLYAAGLPPGGPV